MRILVSNDDGYLSPGIRALMGVLAELGEVTVVAPDRDRSGASNSLTLDRPLRPRCVEPGWYAVDGTPSDCVHLGVTGLVGFTPDLVVSGINHGPNLGDDVLYSGTVAAAAEGRFLGLPAIAVSMNSFDPRHLETAAQVARDLVLRLHTHPLPRDTLLSVNVPDVPYGQLSGLKATRLGRRHPSAPAVGGRDPRGRAIFWIGQAGEADDCGPGTDFHALSEGWVSVTPIRLDMTRHEIIPAVQDWLRS